MKKKYRNIKIIQFFSIFIMFGIVTMSSIQASIYFYTNDNNIDNYYNVKKSVSSSFVEEFYTWDDDFDNQQLIDNSLSEHFFIQDGLIMMDNTYPIWTDPSWSKIKEIVLSSSLPLTGYSLKIVVEYDSNMRSDYGDLRFKFQDDDIWLDYWIEEKNPDPNNKYAIVWLKIASIPQGQSNVYMFYGNPTAEDIGDYWALFNEDSWEKVYAHDHQVTYHMQTEGAWDPDSCFGDDFYMVSWEEGTVPNLLPPTVFQQQIRGCFYDQDGEQYGNRFDITEEETPPYRYENPSIAYGSDKYFVVFENYINPLTNEYLDRDVEGAVITKSGTSVNIDRFDVCTLSNIQADPCVAFDNNNNRFFVIWEDAREGTSNYNLYGRLYGPSGNQIGGEKVICDLPNNQVEPWIAFDSINSHYMVVWEEGDNPEDGPFSIFLQLFNENGVELFDNPILIADGSTNIDYNFPHVVSCSLTESFLVVWQEDDISNNDWSGDIWGQIFDSNGNIVVDTFKIANGEFEIYDVDQYLSSSFFVCYNGGGDIWGKLVSSTGDVTPYTIQISDSSSEPADAPNIATGNDKIFISWEDTRIVYAYPFDNMPDIYANVWNLKIPSGTDVSYDFSEEKNMILDAYITSVEIEPSNWEEWHEFDAIKTGIVSFDILDGNTLELIASDVSPGSNIETISESSIRLKAHLTRINPSSSPTIDKWSVSFIGKDDDPPLTTIENIDGVRGLNEWYVSESVTVWLHAQDYPEDTGSGVDKTYYTLNSGNDQIYNPDGGIQLVTSQSSSWMGQWIINFWSIDKKGNIEDKNKPENRLTVKIDSDMPYVEITEPANEQKVETPFWIRADASDNVEVDHVEFDIEPFGERDGLPYKDYDPPYEWFCDVEEDSIIVKDGVIPLGVNVMIRAQVFDKSGQTWIHESWVYVTNWKSSYFENNMCLLLVTGDGSVMPMKELPLGITFGGELYWEYLSGNCYSLGLGGIFSKAGYHTGVANDFIGYADNNMIIGFASYVSVE